MARRKFNPTGGQIALAAGAAIIGGLALADVYAKPAPKKKTKPAPLPDPDDQEKMIADELIVLISEDPAPGSLYQVRSGNNLATLAQNLLRDFYGLPKNPGAKGSSERKAWQQQSVAYQKCVSSSQFNRTLYGKKGDFNENFPSWTSPDDVSIRSAFLNRSADYISQLLNGNIPVKTSGGGLGLLWLPTIDPQALAQFGKIICVDIDPPPLVALGQQG